MSEANIIEQKDKKDIEALKYRLYQGKTKRLEIIDGYLDKIKAELDTRDLKEIPTPVLTRMFVYFADLAKKEYPQIELQYREEDKRADFDFTTYKTEKVVL
jgi:hypothetical protein